MVGAGDQRILRLDRNRRGHACDTREDALGKPGTVGRRVEGAELRISTTTASDAAAGEIGEIFMRRSPACRISPITTSRRSAPRSTATASSPRRRRLSRRGRLSVPLRPQARHGDLGRRQHLSGRDRGRAACHAGRARLRGVRHSRRGVRRGADGGGGAAARRHARRSARSAPTSSASLADYKVPQAHRDPAATCRARIPARSSSAACAIRIGRRRGGRSEPVELRQVAGAFARSAAVADVATVYDVSDAVHPSKGRCDGFLRFARE